MRSLYRISLAVLAMGFLVVAGSAYAQEMAKPTQTLTGDIGAAFGDFSFDKGSGANAVSPTPANQKAYSEIVTSWESNLRFTWQTDSFTAIGRARVRGNSSGSGTSQSAQTGASNDVVNTQSTENAFLQAGVDFFTEVWWTPGAFKWGIGKFQGQAWSNPLASNYIMRNVIGDKEYWMNWTGVSGTDLEYNFGVLQLGVAVANACVPSCNNNQSNGPSYVQSGASSTGTAVKQNTEDNTMTVTPHIDGKVGDISFRGNLPFASGTINNNALDTPIGISTDKKQATATTSVSGSGYQVGVAWNGPAGVRVALDGQGYTDAHVAAAGQKKDRQRSGLDFRFDINAGPGTLNLAYFSYGDTCPGGDNVQVGQAAISCTFVSSHTYTSTEGTIRYLIPVSFGFIVPEYRSVVSGGSVAPTTVNSTQSNYKDSTSSEFRVIFQGRY